MYLLVVNMGLLLHIQPMRKGQRKDHSKKILSETPLFQKKFLVSKLIKVGILVTLQLNLILVADFFNHRCLLFQYYRLIVIFGP